MDGFQESVRRAVREATLLSPRHAALYRLHEPLQPNLIAVFIGVASAYARRRRGRPSTIAVALTDDDLLLLTAAVRASRWVMGEQLAVVPLDAVSCTPLPEQPYAFRLETPGGERWDLYPKWDTPDSVAIARALVGHPR